MKLHLDGVDREVDADGGDATAVGVVHVDGKPVPIASVGTRAITTIEGIGKPEALRVVQQACP